MLKLTLREYEKIGTSLNTAKHMAKMGYYELAGLGLWSVWLILKQKEDEKGWNKYTNTKCMHRVYTMFKMKLGLTNVQRLKSHLEMIKLVKLTYGLEDEKMRDSA